MMIEYAKDASKHFAVIAAEISQAVEGSTYIKSVV